MKTRLIVKMIDGSSVYSDETEIKEEDLDSYIQFKDLIEQISVVKKFCLKRDGHTVVINPNHVLTVIFQETT